MSKFICLVALTLKLRGRMFTNKGLHVSYLVSLLSMLL